MEMNESTVCMYVCTYTKMNIKGYKDGVGVIAFQRNVCINPPCSSKKDGCMSYTALLMLARKPDKAQSMEDRDIQCMWTCEHLSEHESYRWRLQWGGCLIQWVLRTDSLHCSLWTYIHMYIQYICLLAHALAASPFGGSLVTLTEFCSTLTGKALVGMELR